MATTTTTNFRTADLKRCNFYLQRRAWDALSDVAVDDGLSRSDLLREALSKYLDKRVPGWRTEYS